MKEWLYVYGEVQFIDKKLFVYNRYRVIRLS